MSAPERIWHRAGIAYLRQDNHYPVGTEYVRADIAADLLAALEAAQTSIATFMGVHGYPVDSGAGEILREVSAAIARARGAA